MENNSIYLYYKEFKIGKLSFKENKYIYNSLKGEEKAREKYSMIGYNLYNSNSVKSEYLFDFFELYFIKNIIKKPDLLKIINKTKGDNYFDILFSFAKIKQDDISFYLKDK